MVLSMHRFMSAPDWWRLLGAEWDGFDNVAAHKDRLRALLSRANPRNLLAMMSGHEVAALAGMPETLTVYRGCYGVNADGLCWSLCKTTAREFPTLNRYRRPGDTPMLLTGRVARSRAVLKLCRQENEVISPCVTVLSKEEIQGRGQPIG